MREFKLTSDYIELMKLLKLLRIAQTGGHAKIIVEDGEVVRNGEPEFRKRAKLIKGDVIEVMGETIKIVQLRIKKKEPVVPASILFECVCREITLDGKTSLEKGFCYSTNIFNTKIKVMVPKMVSRIHKQ